MVCQPSHAWRSWASLRLFWKISSVARMSWQGAALPPVAVPATPGSPGYLADFTFPYDPNLSIQYLARSGYGPGKPAKILSIMVSLVIDSASAS